MPSRTFAGFNPDVLRPEAKLAAQQAWQKSAVAREELQYLLKLVQGDLNDLHRALNVQGILLHLLMQKAGVTKDEIAEFTKTFNETLAKEAPDSVASEPVEREKPASSLIVEG